MAPWYTSIPPDRWLAWLLDRGHAPAAELFEAWVRAELDACARIDLLAWDRHLGRLFAELRATTGFETDIEHPADDERAIRRWCWAPGWVTLSQDEDLLLMRDEVLPFLLEEAAAGCTKRAYACGIVAHQVRDQLHGALWPQDKGAPGSAAVLQAVDAALARAEGLLSLARATKDAELLAYLTRLGSYRKPHKVGWDEATARALDVRRCHPHPEIPVVLHQRKRTWIAEIPGWKAPDALHVDVGTGKMFGVRG